MRKVRVAASVHSDKRSPTETGAAGLQLMAGLGFILRKLLGYQIKQVWREMPAKLLKQVWQLKSKLTSAK